MATAIPKNRAELTAKSAAEATRGAIVRGGERRARGIVSDTRAIEGGEAFVALHGETHDGHAFLDEATRRGASLLVVDGERVPDGPDVVRVADTLVAWGDLARAHLRAWRSNEGARTIAITGSAGKTTTKQLCAALLAPSVWASPGNLNNLVGVPAVVFALEASHRFAVVECGMSVRGEIAKLASILTPDVAVITNVGVAHAEGVGGTREDIAREKGALFDALDEGAACVFDADDDLSVALATRSRAARKIGFGRGERASYRLIDRVARGALGSRVTIERPCATCPSPRATEIIELELPFLGEAAAIDLCAALAAAELAAGPLPQDVLDASMKRATNVAGRAGLVDLGAVLVIDDTYNANPSSMRAALGILRDLAPDRRRIAILGEMKELGDASVTEHVALGDALAAAGVALAIGCGGLATDTMNRARALGVEAIAYNDVADATTAALERVRDGDVVLVKGSRSVGAEKIVAALSSARGGAR